MRRLGYQEDLEPVRARSDDEQIRDAEASEAARHALDAMAAPDLGGALPGPQGHDGEAREVLASEAPQPDPERDAATARTVGGSWDDATAERRMEPRARPSEAHLAALDAMAGRRAEPSAPRIDPVAPSVPSPPPAIPDESMAPPDAMESGRALGTPTLPPADEREGFVTDAESEAMPPVPGDDELDEDNAAQLDALDAMAGREAAPKAAPTESEPMLDDGLPTAGEIQTARDWDVPRSIFRSLQNGLLGAIGRPRREYEGEGDALQERRDEGMQDRMQAKGVQRREETAAARAASDAEAEAAQAAASGARADRSLELRERADERAERSTGSLIESRDATRTRADSAEARRETAAGASEDPDSPASQAERLAFSVARLRLRGADAQALDEALTSEGIDPQHASAAQLRRANDIIRTIGVRGGRGGGTGGGSGTRQALAQQLVDADDTGQTTMDEALARIDALGTTGARGHLRHQLEAREEGGSEGEEIFAGVRAGVDISPAERNSLRQMYAAARAQHGSLSTVRDIAGRYGATGRIDPDAAAEMSAPLRRLMSMVATMQNTGVINPGEMDAIMAALPDPTSLSQMTFGTLQSRLDGFERELDSGIASALDARSVDPAGVERVMRGLRGGTMARERGAAPTGAPSARGAPTSSGARVRVRRRDGSVGTVPRAAWEASDEEDRDGAVEVP